MRRHVLAPLVLVLTGCGAPPVDAAPPDAPPDVASACRGLAGSLPDTLEDERRRSTHPESPLTAAWGVPAIVLRCGVPRPSGYAPEGSVIGVNGVDWLPQRTEWGYVFTTVRRRADVEVRVPKEYAPELNPLTELSGPILQHL